MSQPMKSMFNLILRDQTTFGMEYLEARHMIFFIVHIYSLPKPRAIV